jgi:hypothetical protein
MGGKGSGRPRRTACRCGLPYSYVDNRGQRRCRTCERKRKGYQGVTKNKTKVHLMVRQYKISLKHCVSCKIEINETNFMMFALDHRDPAQKLFNLSQANSQPRHLVLAECQKCELMCHNCHHLKTHKSGDHKVRRDEATVQDEYLPLLEMMYAAD